jgi:hypothetical protein
MFRGVRSRGIGTDRTCMKVLEETTWESSTLGGNLPGNRTDVSMHPTTSSTDEVETQSYSIHLLRTTSPIHSAT